MSQSFVDLYEDNTNSATVATELSFYEEVTDTVGKWADVALDATVLVTTDVYAGTTKVVGTTYEVAKQNVLNTKKYFDAGRNQSKDRIAARIAKHLGK